MANDSLDSIRSSLTSAMQETEQGAILIADDDPKIVELVSTALKDDGWSTIHAYNGQEVLDKVYTRRVAALILDMRMPELDGYEVCLELCRRGVVLPILVITGNIGDAEPLNFLNVSKTLLKPLKLEEVIEFARDVVPT